MLEVGRRESPQGRRGGRVTLVEGDAQRLPVPSDTFGVVSVAFGLRNVRDTVRGIDELIRVARPGGKVAILEFSRPAGWILGRLYLAFFRHLLPRIGQALAPNDDGAYDYLPRSVLEFPDGQAMLDLLASRGLTSLATPSPDLRDRHALSRHQRPGAGPAPTERDSMTSPVLRPATTWSWPSRAPAARPTPSDCSRSSAGWDVRST